MRDFGLAGLGGIGDPSSLRRRAEEAMAGLEVDARRGVPQEGTDASRSVRVTVTPDGAVADVSISRQWQGRISVEELGAAVLSAYRQADQKRVLAGVRVADDQPDIDVTPSPTSDIDDPRWLDRVWETLNDSRRRLEHLSSGRSAANAGEEHRVAGPAGLVRLRVVGAAVQEVLIDGVHTAQRDPDAVAGDLRAAFRAIRRG